MIAPWVKEELGTADFGDERLCTRGATLLSTLANRPNLSIPAACGGRAEMVAAYRFFDNDKVTFNKVLEAHIARTLERMAVQKVVLLVQDTTEIDQTRPEQEVVGAGALDGSRRGFLLHEMHAFMPEGIPLGTVWAEILNRTDGVSHASEPEKLKKRQHTSIEEKESMRWLTGLRQAREVAQQLPGVQCVCMADSEADIYELFCEPRGELHWLIRACQDRVLEADTPQHLREPLLAAPVLYKVELLIRGRHARLTTEDRARRQNRETRQAEVEVRAARQPRRVCRTLSKRWHTPWAFPKMSTSLFSKK